MKNELHKIWALRLAKEYENICFQYRVKLKMPLIVVENLKNSWGLWDALGRKISISYELILNHSWENVICVLKHEMAHQITQEIFQSQDNHGPDFLKSCERIGLPKSFCKASISLQESFAHWKDENHEQEDVAILRKIEKLLNLAQSANENEAVLAMENVQNLYEKYHIKKILEQSHQDYFSLVFNLKKRKVPSSYSLISYILQQHFFVKSIFSELYDPFLDEVHKTIEVFGSRHNVLMAEYVFHFLRDRIDLLWKQYQKSKKLPVRYKMSYQQGILEGFLKKLDALKEAKQNRQSQSVSSHSSHMPVCAQWIKQDEINLDAFVQKKYPRLSQRGNSSRVYSDHFDKGIQAGHQLNLNKPVHSKSSDQKLLR